MSHFVLHIFAPASVTHYSYSQTHLLYLSRIDLDAKVELEKLIGKQTTYDVLNQNKNVTYHCMHHDVGAKIL